MKGIGLALALATAWQVGAAVPLNTTSLEKTLRQLENEIAAVRGLAFKKPVVAKVIARPKDTSKKAQGYYSVPDKVLFLYDDLAGHYRRGVLVHEMVHVLQDQHFGLKQLHQASNSDAEMALAALVEGDATLTMIEVLKKEQPRVAAMLDTPLVGAVNLENSFLYGQGARYVKTLKQRGGWEAVNRAYKSPPRSTAAVLHSEGVPSVDLGPGKTRGELALIRLLSEKLQSAPLAVQAAAGWRGDRVIEEGQASAWVVAFATSDQALRCQAALVQHHRALHDEWSESSLATDSHSWRGPAGQRSAVLTRGNRVLMVEAGQETAFKNLLERLQGPPQLRIYSSRDRRAVTFGEMVDRLREVDLVCIGEKHDSARDHEVQLQVIKALHACDDRLAVGLEMFQRPYQAELDRYGRGELGEEEMLKATEYRTRWGFDWSLYRPIVTFCQRNGLALVALNAPRELTRRLGAVGHAKMTDEEKNKLGPIDFNVAPHRAYWYEELPRLHGNNKATAEEKEKSYQVMATWDDYMATSAVDFFKSRGLRRLVVLAGGGHIERGFGIPERAAKRASCKVATVRLIDGGSYDKIAADPLADFAIVIE